MQFFQIFVFTYIHYDEIFVVVVVTVSIKCISHFEVQAVWLLALPLSHYVTAASAYESF